MRNLLARCCFLLSVALAFAAGAQEFNQPAQVRAQTSQAAQQADQQAGQGDQAAPQPQGEDQGQQGDQAQPGDQAEQGDQNAEGENEAQRAAQGDQVKMAPGARDQAPGETHTVVRGDTLWDLSQKYLGSPWYWPKVWSYNPQIANPHWIYPGNQIKFFTEGEAAPSEVEAATPPTEVSEAAPPTAPGELPSEGEDVIPVSELEGEDSAVHVTGKIAYRPTNSIRYTASGFMTSTELRDSGTIKASFAESLMLSTPDVVYLSLRNPSGVKVGDKFLVFASGEQVVHPITKRMVGVLTHLKGVIQVDRVPPGQAVRGHIIEAYADMYRGDTIGPYSEQFHQTVVPVPNARALEGYVVTALVPFLTMTGEHSLLIIDRGASDGVQVGNTFTIVRNGDPNNAPINPASHQDPSLPQEDVATCLAMEVKDVASTCLLTRSIREVVPGDRVVMRPASGPKVGELLR